MTGKVLIGPSSEFDGPDDESHPPAAHGRHRAFFTHFPGPGFPIIHQSYHGPRFSAISRGNPSSFEPVPTLRKHVLDPYRHPGDAQSFRSCLFSI
jgi:hypothetical protein